MRPDTMTRSRPADPGATAWGPRPLLAVLGVAVLVAALVVTGLGYAIYYAIGATSATTAAVARSTQARTAGPGDSQPGHAPGPAAGTDGAAEAGGVSRRDAIAARPMLAVDPAAGRSGIPAAVPAPGIAIPPATATGPSRVPTGFPRTPAGAVGQLAAIETSVLSAMSLPGTREVYREWALPGGPGAPRWPLTFNVRAFLSGAGAVGQGAGAAAGQAKDPTVVVTPTPVAAQVKGVDGDGWVLACVLLDVRAVIVTSARIAYGYCERMQWTATAAGSAGRWMIAPGQPPALAPATWPGTALAARAGWCTWVQTDSAGTGGIPAGRAGDGAG
jgi:hypothetical protein